MNFAFDWLISSICDEYYYPVVMGWSSNLLIALYIHCKYRCTRYKTEEMSFRKHTKDPRTLIWPPAHRRDAAIMLECLHSLYCSTSIDTVNATSSVERDLSEEGFFLHPLCFAVQTTHNPCAVAPQSNKSSCLHFLFQFHFMHQTTRSRLTNPRTNRKKNHDFLFWYWMWIRHDCCRIEAYTCNGNIFILLTVIKTGHIS